MATDNAAKFHAAKVAMRRRCLDLIRPAHVLDLFAGIDWERSMWGHAWRDADSYLGCDRRWAPWDPRTRFVVPNELALECVDVERFNIFDLDAYGSPVPLADRLQELRTWRPGELGALILTDGAWGNAKFSGTSRVQQSLGLSPFGTHWDEYVPAWLRFVDDWLVASRVTELERTFEGGLTGNGGTRMCYLATIFRGAE